MWIFRMLEVTPSQATAWFRWSFVSTTAISTQPTPTLISFHEMPVVTGEKSSASLSHFCLIIDMFWSPPHRRQGQSDHSPLQYLVMQWSLCKRPEVRRCQAEVSIAPSTNRIFSSFWYEWSFQMYVDPLYPAVHVTYHGVLSYSDPQFNRHNTSASYFYYQAIQVIAPTSGTYIFTSDSSIDTFGYFYQTSVDPSYPAQNLITSDDDSGSREQFSFSVYLSSGSIYVLLVTTFSPGILGSFTIDASGPLGVQMAMILLSTSRPIGTTSECVWILHVVNRDQLLRSSKHSIHLRRLLIHQQSEVLSIDSVWRIPILSSSPSSCLHKWHMHVDEQQFDRYLRVFLRLSGRPIWSSPELDQIRWR